jgi:hypothetical protein
MWTQDASEPLRCDALLEFLVNTPRVEIAVVVA